MAAAQKEQISAGTCQEYATSDPGPNIAQKNRMDQLPPLSTGRNLPSLIKEEPLSDHEQSNKSVTFSAKPLNIKVRCFRCSICREQFEDAASCIAHVNSHKKDASDNKKTTEKQTLSSSKTDAGNALSKTDGNSHMKYEPKKVAEKHAPSSSQANASSVTCIPDVNICRNRKDGASESTEKLSLSSRQMCEKGSLCQPVSSHSKDKAESGANTSELHATSSSQTAVVSKITFPRGGTRRERPVRLRGFQKKTSTCSSSERARMSKPKLRVLVRKLTERELQLWRCDRRANSSSLTSGIKEREKSTINANQSSSSRKTNLVANEQSVIKPNRTLIAPPLDQNLVSRESNTIEASWLILSGAQLHVLGEQYTMRPLHTSLGNHQTRKFHLNRRIANRTSSPSGGSLPESETTNTKSSATSLSHSNGSSGSLPESKTMNKSSPASSQTHSKVSFRNLADSKITNSNISVSSLSPCNESGFSVLGDKTSLTSSASPEVRFPNRVNSSAAGLKTARNRTVVVIDGEIPTKYKMLANFSMMESEETIMRGRQHQEMAETSKTTEMGGRAAHEIRQVEHSSTSTLSSAESHWDPRSKENSLINELSVNSINTTTASDTENPDVCPRYVCCYCRTEFVSFGTCNLHMKTVHGTTAIKPDEMIRLGARKSILGRHVYEEKSQTGRQLPQTFMCSLCPRQCLCLEDCNAHMASCHSEFLKQKRMLDMSERERTSRKRKVLQPAKSQENVPVPVKKLRGVDDKLSSGQANVEEILQLCNSVLQENVRTVQKTTSFDDEKQLKVTIITVAGEHDEGCCKPVRLADPSVRSDHAEGKKENIVPSGLAHAVRSEVVEMVNGNTESGRRSARADIVKESCDLDADPTRRPDDLNTVELNGIESDSDPGTEKVIETFDESDPALPPCVPEKIEEKNERSESEPARRSDHAIKRAKKKADKTKIQVPYHYMCAVCSKKFSTLEECCNHMRSTHYVKKCNSLTSTPAQDGVGELQNHNGKEDSEDIANKLQGSSITYACSACMQKFPTNEECTNHILNIHSVMSPATLKRKEGDKFNYKRPRQKKGEAQELANQRKRKQEELVKKRDKEERKLARTRRREQRRIAKLIRRRKRAQEKRSRLRKEFYARLAIQNLPANMEGTFRKIQTKCGLTGHPKCYECSKYSKGLDKQTNQKIMDGLTKKRDWLKDKMSGKEVSSLFHLHNYFECYICREAYRYNYHYKRHMKCHEDLICPMCKMSFQSQHALSCHIQVHNCGPLRCEKCSETFYSSKGLLDHLLSHEGVFRCDICQETYSSKPNLKRHITVRHEGRKEFKCEHEKCGFSVYSRALLKAHVSHVHENKKEYICHVCGEQYKCHRYLRWHMSVHADGMVICEECGCWFQETSQLILHKQRVHSAGNVCKTKRRRIPLWKKYTFKRKQFDYTGAVLRCVVCPEVFGNLTLWKAHVERHRDAESGQFKCGICPLQFSEYDALRDHADEHYKLTLMNGCQLCGQVYPSKEDMHGHKCSLLSHPPPVAVTEEPIAEVISSPQIEGSVCQEQTV